MRQLELRIKTNFMKDDNSGIMVRTVSNDKKGFLVERTGTKRDCCKDPDGEMTLRESAADAGYE